VKPKVLVVDDRKENLVAFEAVLEGLPCQLCTARSGEEALRWMLTDSFAVVLLDVQMPGIDGYATAAAIKERERTRDVPIIFLSAIDRDVHHQLQGYGVGAVDFLAKPFLPEVLRAKVSVFLTLYEQHQLIDLQCRQLAAQLAELTEAQGRLSELTEELQRSNTELDNFAAAVSHRLREPVQVAAGLLELCLERYPHGASATGLELVGRAAGLLRLLGEDIEQLLVSAEPEGSFGDRQRADLTSALSRAVEAVTGDIGTRGAVVSSDPLPVVEGDPWQLELVFRHILENALRHGEARSVHFGFSRAGEDWVVWGHDDGKGIEASKLAALLTPPASTAPGNRPGQGLGLLSCERIVARHGGRMWVTSDIGAGTTVSFSLPALRDGPGSNGASGHGHGAGPSRDGAGAGEPRRGRGGVAAEGGTVGR